MCGFGIKLKGTLFLDVYVYVCVCSCCRRPGGVIIHTTIVSAGFDKRAAGSTNECLRCPFFLSGLICAAGKYILMGTIHDTIIHEMTMLFPRYSICFISLAEVFHCFLL